MRVSQRGGIGSRSKAMPTGRCSPSPASIAQWNGPIKKDGDNVDIEVFSFRTTLPNALTCTINHERSPVLLTEEMQFEQDHAV